MGSLIPEAAGACYETDGVVLIYFILFFNLMCFKVMFFFPDVINVNSQKIVELEDALKQHGLTFTVLLMGTFFFLSECMLVKSFN